MIRFLANSKYSKWLSSLLAFVIFFNNIIFPTRSFALTGGPSQPEFSGFEPAASSEMVNLFTGDFSYNIPLMDVDGYPINIAYHASPSMDQEASWVGLGWNLNVGAINRGMRGLPDDFNGDPVNRALNIEPYKAWGVSTGYFGELAGADFSSVLSLNFAGSLGVVHSNYKGMGLEFGINAGLGVSAIGEETSGGLTAGLGLKFSSQDGTDIYPQVGISGKMSSNNKGASLGLNIGCAINSREGLKNVYGGYSISANSGDKQNTGEGPKRGAGIGVGQSASIPASSQGYMPSMIANMSSQAYSVNFKLGANGCVYSQGGSISGFYAQNGIADPDKRRSYEAYGYLFSQNASDNDLHDFNREKDGMMYPEIPNMPVTNYTYDMFSASAQGLMYAFRPYRNDIGNLHDNSTAESSFGIGAGVELMLSSDVNLGVNVDVMFSNGESGRWKDDNDFNIHSTFSSESYDGNNVSAYEPAYFKVAGEKTPDDDSFLNYITATSDDAVRVSLDKKTNTVYRATETLVDKLGNQAITSLSGTGYPVTKSKRATRNQLVSYLNAAEAAQFGLSKKIEVYPELTSASLAASSFDDHIIQASAGSATPAGEFIPSYHTGLDLARNGTFSNNKFYHLSQMTITQDNGSRYVYGIPVYNRSQTDATFNVASATTNSAVTDGQVSYNHGQDNVPGSNNNGIDKFAETRTIPDYSHSFLLSSVLSSDYVDRTGNGPSIDDYGDYTKFNYSRVTNGYNWRIPFNNASFSQGFLADNLDNKGTYMYGQKDLWYLHSVETKNYVALFILNSDTRADAYPAQDENGGIAATNTSRYLKEIRLYAKKDFTHGGIANSKPIKIVNFEYDYSLCPNVPNNDQQARTVGSANINQNKGKLTLKKIYFTYGASQKGKLSPYLFDYADINFDGVVDADENPAYNQSAVDRWGYYKPNAGGADNNLDFPYVKQDDANAAKHAAAWSLTQVRTPAGSTIKVNYEADDYAYVQNTQAAEMFKVVGCGVSSEFSSVSGSLPGGDYIFVDLSPSNDGGIPTSNTTSYNNEFAAKYLKNLKSLYFKCRVKLYKDYDEYVPGYADIDSYGVNTDPDKIYTYNGVTYYKYAYIKVKEVGINDKEQGQLIHPVMKAAFQMGRMYLPQIVFPGSQPSSGNGNAFMGLLTTLQDAKHLLKGINKALYDRNIARSILPDYSRVRLYNPNGKKSGGGSRVSRITISDGWNGMSGENDATYGQEYSYTTTASNGTISSGVASYEPMVGADEISQRYPVDFSIKRKFAPNDEYFQEEPIGESFYPDPLVVYSKVSVKNLTRTSGNTVIVTNHATGHTEYEFYTAKDFPVVTDRTDLAKQRVKPKLLLSILKFGSTDKLYLSQGYVIKTNDMHGKLKSQKMFAEGKTLPLSGITYYYKTRTGPKSQELDNTVDVIDKATNTISQKSIGKTTDFVSDSRSSLSNNYGIGLGLNIVEPVCTDYIPLVFVWPSFSQEKRAFYSMGTTKLIQQYGLVDYVEAFENNSVVTTKNMLYDNLTGEVLLTQTKNDFDAPVYNFKYPAYWAYDRMGGAFDNTAVSFMASVVNASTGLLPANGFFHPGDEVAIIDPTTPANNKKAWVIEDRAGGTGLYLADQSGQAVTNIANTTAAIPSYLKILRSGNRNMQSLPMASLLSLQTPVSGNAVSVNVNTKVINASAVEYSDNWNLLCGDKTGDNSCSCTETQAMVNLRSALVAIIGHGWQKVPSTSVYDKFGFAPGTFADQGLAPLIQSFSWFGGCANTSLLNSWEHVYLTATPSIVQTSTSPLLYDHKVTLTFTGSGGFCSGTSCPIVLVAKNVTHNKYNVWNYLNGLRDVVATPTDGCQPSTQFSMVGGTSLPSDDPGNFSYTGSSCYTLTNCTNNNTLIQCGKVVGDVINPYYENIRGNWRVKRSYSYLVDRSQISQGNPTMNGDIRHDGAYNAFAPFWSYSGSAWKPIYTVSGGYDKWVKNNEVEKVNPYGNVLQAADVLGRRSASLYGYNHTLPVAAGNNAYYNQLAFDGFEDYSYIQNECALSLTGNTPTTNSSGYIEHFNYYNYKSNLTLSESHTGRYSIQVPAYNNMAVTRKLTNPSCSGAADNVPYTIKDCDCIGLFGPFYNYAQPQKFVLSVWAKQALASTTPVTQYPAAGVSVVLNGSILNTAQPKISAIINGWQKLDYEFTVPASSASGNITVSLLNSSSNAMYYDDIRIHPFNSSMKSMVYDPYSLRLMAELDDRNFATLYEYDEEGTLVRIKKETEKGIYTIKESRSGIIK